MNERAVRKRASARYVLYGVLWIAFCGAVGMVLDLVLEIHHGAVFFLLGGIADHVAGWIEERRRREG